MPVAPGRPIPVPGRPPRREAVVVVVVHQEPLELFVDLLGAHVELADRLGLGPRALDLIAVVLPRLLHVEAQGPLRDVLDQALHRRAEVRVVHGQPAALLDRVDERVLVAVDDQTRLRRCRPACLLGLRFSNRVRRSDDQRLEPLLNDQALAEHSEDDEGEHAAQGHLEEHRRLGRRQAALDAAALDRCDRRQIRALAFLRAPLEEGAQQDDAGDRVELRLG